MAKKKQDDLTPRQRQSRKIMHEKAVRKKRKALVRRMQIIGLAVLAFTFIGGGLWLWLSGTASRAVTQAVDGVYAFTVHAGFSVENLYLEGRNRTSMEEINAALGIAHGSPILRVDLGEAKERLESIKSVQHAAVERALPHTLYIRIVEREPVALWQYQGKMALVDENGIVMTGIDSAPYQHLPLIVGYDAPAHIGELMGILASEPDLAQRFTAAVRMGDRRWNIRLSRDIEVKLPENEPLLAWKKLAELQERGQLLDRDIKVIDLRLDGRLFITVTPQHMPRQKPGNAKET